MERKKEGRKIHKNQEEDGRKGGLREGKGVRMIGSRSSKKRGRREARKRKEGDRRRKARESDEKREVRTKKKTEGREGSGDGESN